MELLVRSDKAILLANVEVIKVNRIERANPLLGYIVLYRDASQIFNYI
jgi:hypothetical protein